MINFSQQKLDDFFTATQTKGDFTTSIDNIDYTICGRVSADTKRFITISDANNPNDSATYESDKSGFWVKVPESLI